jgi:hypothetical protein
MILNDITNASNSIFYSVALLIVAIISAIFSVSMKTTTDGAIIVFITVITFILPLFAGFKMGIFELNKWNKLIGTYFILTQIMFVYTIFSSYIYGKKKVEDGKKISNNGEIDSEIAAYNMYKYGKYDNFKIWFAAISNEPWFDLMATAMFVLMPMPFLPVAHGERFEVFLAKLGIYKISTTIILGSPKFNPIENEKHHVKQTNSSKFIEGSFYATMILYAGSWIYSKYTK